MEDRLWKMLPVAVLVVQGLFVWVLWSLRRNFVSCDACAAARAAHDKRQADHRAEYDKRQADYDKRLGCMAAESKELRTSLDSLPKAKDLHEVAKEVEAVRGGLEAVKESVKSLGISIDRLDKPIQLLLEHHINGGGK